MPTATQITLTQLDLTGARCPALCCSGLQPSTPRPQARSSPPSAAPCSGSGSAPALARMAQEFGDHPDVTASRMCSVRQLIPSGTRGQAAGGRT